MDKKLLVCAGGSLALFLPAFSASVAMPEAGTKKINVVYILADDMGYGDLGCLGQTKILTPNIDRLAREGMLFTQHYAGSTVSAPSRSALMTGQCTGHTPIRGNKEVVSGGVQGQYPIPADTYTLAEMFRSAGYVTGAFGKWGLGFPGSEGDPIKQGFDEFFGYNCQALAHRYYPHHLWHNDRQVVLEGNADYKTGDYSGDIIHAQALKFIEAHAGEPFFLFLPYTLPHAELTVPQDDIIAYYRGKFQEVPFEGDDYGPGMTSAGYCSQNEPYATYAAMVTRFDKYVGEVVDALREKGLDRNTIIMVTSDNGPHREGGANPAFFDSYGPFRGIKRDLYEGGIRVPLVAWAPGMVPAGGKNTHICAFWDMMPTFAQLLGVDIPAGIQSDGISILPALTGKKQKAAHDYLYWEFHEQGGSIAVRWGNWKAVRRKVFTPGTHTELYDLSKDIHEDHDVSAANPKIVAQMEEMMKRTHRDSEVFPFPARWKE